VECPSCKRPNVAAATQCAYCGFWFPVDRPLFKKTSVAIMIVLNIITAGLYVPYWFLSRRPAINGLRSERKIGAAPFVFLVIVMLASLSASILSGFAEGAEADGVDGIFGPGQSTTLLDLVARVLDLLAVFVLLFETFHVRGILQDHFGVRLSGVFTFVFNVLYLQYKINRLETR